MREKIPVMNVHKPPRMEIPVKIVDGLTSLTIESAPGKSFATAGMKILRDDKISPEMGGSGSGNTLSILKMYKS